MDLSTLNKPWQPCRSGQGGTDNSNNHSSVSVLSITTSNRTLGTLTSQQETTHLFNSGRERNAKFDDSHSFCEKKKNFFCELRLRLEGLPPMGPSKPAAAFSRTWSGAGWGSLSG
jgi:hypothetical protein